MIRSTFRLPAMLAAASLIGLVVALTGDGWRDALSWLALILPVAAVGWAVTRSPRTSTRAAGGGNIRKSNP